VRIVSGIISPDDLASAYSEAVQQIDELKTQMAAQRIVAAVCADQSIVMVKGVEHLSGKESLSALQIQCKLPVFAEALIYAFGDGSLPLRATDVMPSPPSVLDRHREAT